MSEKWDAFLVIRLLFTGRRHVIRRKSAQMNLKHRLVLPAFLLVWLLHATTNHVLWQLIRKQAPKCAATLFARIFPAFAQQLFGNSGCFQCSSGRRYSGCLEFTNLKKRFENVRYTTRHSNLESKRFLIRPKVKRGSLNNLACNLTRQNRRCSLYSCRIHLLCLHSAMDRPRKQTLGNRPKKN